MYKMDSFAQEVTPRCDVMYSVEPYAVIAAAAAGPTDRLGKLAARQQAILDSLAALSAQIDSLGPAPQGGSPKPAAGSTAAGSGGVKLDKHGHPLPDASHARPLPATTDVSLLCSPSNPPYATLLAASVIAERVGEVQIRQFWHSTLPLPAGFRSENPFNGVGCPLPVARCPRALALVPAVPWAPAFLIPPRARPRAGWLQRRTTARPG